MQDFRDALDTCGFLDLGFTGLYFTWQGNRHGHVVWERLDRGVANYDWMAKFPAATVSHLHCIASDHRPIPLLFDLNGESVRWKCKPFRFEEMWLADRGCSDAVKKAWEVRPKGQPIYRVVHKIKSVSECYTSGVRIILEV